MVPAAPTLDAHQRRLLARRRCGRCAEVVPARAVLRQGTCPHCTSALEMSCGGSGVLEEVRRGWRRWRLGVYGLVFLGHLLAGFVPLLPSLLLLVGLLGAHLMVLRRPLAWLGPVRRLLTRFLLAVLLALLSLAGLFANLLAVPLLALLGSGVLVSALTGLLGTALYVEGGLLLVRHRLEREARDPRLALWEWLLPLGAAGLLLGGAFASVLLLRGAWWLLVEAPIPAVADLARLLGGA